MEVVNLADPTGRQLIQEDSNNKGETMEHLFLKFEESNKTNVYSFQINDRKLNFEEQKFPPKSASGSFFVSF